MRAAPLRWSLDFTRLLSEPQLAGVDQVGQDLQLAEVGQVGQDLELADQTGHRALTDDVALGLGECAEHMEDQLASARGGVDVLRQTAEPDLALLELRRSRVSPRPDRRAPARRARCSPG